LPLFVQRDPLPRVLVYVVPVVFVSIALNIPKWFETTIEYEPINPVEK
jgi:hypothetical protein